MTLADWHGPPILCWPENRQAVEVFLTLRTQWRAGMSGFTGLDYAVLPEMWRRLRVPPADRDSTFADLQVLEQAALEAMHTKE